MCPFTVAGVLVPKGPVALRAGSGRRHPHAHLHRQAKVLGTSQANAALGRHDHGAGRSARRRWTTPRRRCGPLLRQRHRLQPDQDDDFTIRNLAEVFAAQESSARVMSILLGAIASVSLIVGGIGIMNIMLVSRHRTDARDRAAPGHRRQDARHPVAVPGGGGDALAAGRLIGIVIGVAASLLISYFAEWSTLVSPTAILLAFVFSGLVGVFFGYYPARKAALLDPIDALRYE